MKEHISADRIANEIRMLRGPSFLGAFLIVEGPSDLKGYAHFVDQGSCRIRPAHGRDNAIGALNILDKDGFKGVLAIVDADFWRLEGTKPPSPNLFITDTHDLETMILKSRALEKLLTEFGSETKIGQLGKSVRNILLDSGVQIGYLRWVSHREKLWLKFEGITFSNFIDDKTLDIDTADMITEVKNKSRRHDLNDEDLLKSMSGLANSSHDPWDVCCGHDLVGILSHGFRKALGSLNTQQTKPELIEKSLRLAYEATYFFATQLYKSLKTWEETNPPYQVFPTP